MGVFITLQTDNDSYCQVLETNVSHKQECIPVGCVPAARRPYSRVCFPGGGGEGVGFCLVWGKSFLPVPGGFLPVPGWGGWVLTAQGGRSLVWGVGSHCPGGALPARGVLPGPGGLSLPGDPPVNRITHTCKNITLATTSLRPVTSTTGN